MSHEENERIVSVLGDLALAVIEAGALVAAALVFSALISADNSSKREFSEVLKMVKKS